MNMMIIPIWVLTYISISIIAISSGRLEPPIPSILQISPQTQPEAKIVHQHGLNKKILISLLASSILLAGTLISLFCLWIYKEKSRSKAEPTSHQQTHGSSKKTGSVCLIDYEFLVTATNGFHENNVIGNGRFGHVYKASLNDTLVAGNGRFDLDYKASLNDTLVAVKIFENGDLDAQKEFEKEIEWSSKIQHQNIVSVLGYCVHDHKRFLVYEMMHNGCLDFHLHGPSQGSALTWHLRMKIALDISRALEFLHENCHPVVIHRDIRSSNILLDSNFNAKISHFGLAISGGTINKNNVKLPETTSGYVAPEFLSEGKLTDKSDVYAFGIILLELLMGRRPIEETSEEFIVNWAMPHLTDRTKLPKIVDPVIQNTMDVKHLYQVAAVTVLCVQQEPSYRPLITDVLHSLIPLVPLELGGSLRVQEK